MVGMKLFIIAGAALAAAAYKVESYGGEKDCIAWKCDDGEVPTEDDQCDIYLSANRTHYLTPCSSKNAYCNYVKTEDSDSIGLCEQNEVTSVTSYPGEYCDDTTYICKENIACTNNVCVGLAAGKSCSQDYDCDIGHYCNSANVKVCDVRHEIGQACTSDSQCVTNARCLTNYDSTLTCVKLFSLVPGTEMSEAGCSANPGLKFALNWFCSSGYCGLDESRRSFCTDPIRSPHQLEEDYVCQSSNTNSCDSVQDQYIGFSIKGHCKCGYNSEGNAYCTSFLGDDHVEEYFNATVEYYQNAVVNCNRPLAKDYQKDNINQCLIRTDGSEAAMKYYLSKLEYLNMPDYIANDGCVMETINTEYWTLYEEINSDDGDDQDDDDTAETLISLASAAIFLMF